MTSDDRPAGHAPGGAGNGTGTGTGRAPASAEAPGTASGTAPVVTAGTRLQPTLKLGSIVLFGLAYMTPLIVLGTFGILAEASKGATASAYLLAMGAVLFTAFSYGRLAALHPVAGSAYTYVRRTIDSRVGFLVGWAVLLDYVFIPMVIWLIGAAYLSAQYPSVPQGVWIGSFVALTSALNVIGVRTAARANMLLMALQVGVLVTFVVLSVVNVARGHGAGTLVSTTPFVHPGTSVSAVAAAAALAAYSFLGFDAVTTLTEETVNPQRVIPRGIMLTALIGGAIFVVVAYTTQLVHPGGGFQDPSSGAFEIARDIGGAAFSSLFLAGLIVAQAAAGLAAQAGASRLLFAMGRDGVLPARVFGYLHPRYRTPAYSVLVCGAIGLIALNLSVTTSTSFINFGAFTAFTFVNLALVAHLVRTRADTTPLALARALVIPAIGAVVDVWLLTKLDHNAIVLGCLWLAIGTIYLAWLTRGFRSEPPALPDTQEGAT